MFVVFFLYFSYIQIKLQIRLFIVLILQPACDVILTVLLAPADVCPFMQEINSLSN
jgi:hypothetical protein